MWCKGVKGFRQDTQQGTEGEDGLEITELEGRSGEVSLSEGLRVEGLLLDMGGRGLGDVDLRPVIISAVGNPDTSAPGKGLFILQREGL